MNVQAQWLEWLSIAIDKLRRIFHSKIADRAGVGDENRLAMSKRWPTSVLFNDCVDRSNSFLQAAASMIDEQQRSMSSLKWNKFSLQLFIFWENKKINRKYWMYDRKNEEVRDAVKENDIERNENKIQVYCAQNTQMSLCSLGRNHIFHEFCGEL